MFQNLDLEYLYLLNLTKERAPWKLFRKLGKDSTNRQNDNTLSLQPIQVRLQEKYNNHNRRINFQLVVLINALALRVFSCRNWPWVFINVKGEPKTMDDGAMVDINATAEPYRANKPDLRKEPPPLCL
jgi:hypothetical protein